MSVSEEVVQVIVEWMELSMARTMHKLNQFIRAEDLSMPQFGILMRLYHEEVCGITDISRHMGVTNAAVSQLIDRLVEKQLIERSEDPADRRAKKIVLTPKGRELVESGAKQRSLLVEKLAARLTSEQQEAVLRTFPEMIKALKGLPE